MRKIFLSTILVLLVFQAISQQSFRLHVQPGKPQLAGDGDDYTTLVITARDKEGEVITTINGKVALRVSAGFCEAIEVNMQSGVAMVKYTSPMFGTPIKASQRMVYFLFKFMQKFIARSAGSTDAAANQKLATDITIESFKEGLIPVTLIPKKDGDNFAYIVCEMNGVKGKAKIEILKATEGRNGSIVPGVYYGRDITGQSDWKLNLYSSGTGTFGEANSPEDDYNTIMFSNEVFTEMNDVLGKTAGMTGFLKAYLGPSWKETKYIENFDIVKMGMGSAYMPMPNNGVFIYVPPILFEYQGRPTNSSSGSSTNGKPEEVIKTDKSGIVLSQNEIIGDGKSRTRAVFHYQDENGVPVSGKTIAWSIPQGIKQISVQTITDANGNAESMLEAPVLKATGETRGENTGQIIDNYDLYKITVNYSSPKRANDYTEAYLSIYKTIERNVRILKPGFEAKSFKLLLPQLENFKLESSVYAIVEMINSNSSTDKAGVKDAVVFIERKKFDEEKFNRNYELYFKKDRKLFLNMIDDEKGGFFAITNGEGKFALKVGLNPDKKLSMEPLQAKLSDLTGRRKGSLVKVLNLFEDADFQDKVIQKLFTIDKTLCAADHMNAVYNEEKLHILGSLMTNTNGAAVFMRDCAKNFSQQSWEAFKYLFFLAADKYKWNEKVAKWAGNTETGKKLVDAGISLDKYLWNDVAGQNAENGTKSMILRFMYNNLTNQKVFATQEYYRLLGASANYVLVKKEKKMMDAIADAVVKYLPYPEKLTDMFITMYYTDLKDEITKLLNQDPQKIHTVYEKLQPAIVDRSTELRQHYLDIASWRLNLELFKAYKDLTTELVAKSAIIIVDAASGNYMSIKSHLDMLSNANKVLDAAYITSRLIIEFQNYRNLWAESDAAFFYANRCIEQGTLNPVTQNTDICFSLFPAAMAAELPDGNSLRGVPIVTGNRLSLSGGLLPVNELNKFYNGYPDFENWFVQNDEKLLWLSVADPDEFTRIIKSREAYSDDLAKLTILALGITENPADAQLKKQWVEFAGNLAGSSSQLIKDADDAAKKMHEMPVNPAVGSPETTIGKAIDKKWIIYGGAGLGSLIIILTVVIFFRRKRLIKRVVQQQPKAPTNGIVMQQYTSTEKINPTSDIQHSTSNIITPKFCPKCGSAFMPGAKFCGKCGFKPV